MSLKLNRIGLALDAVPKYIKLEKVRKFLLVHNGVENVQELHSWAMSTTKGALTAHLIIPEDFWYIKA